MAWKKLNEYVDFWDKPVLGTEKQEDKKRFMALCIDEDSKNPYLGIARKITKRQGNPDVPGFIDKSKLVIVKSEDLLSWKVVSDLNIEGVDELIEKLGTDKNYFIGLEDPDIWTGEAGKKHVYFTIAYKKKNERGYDLYLGHAFGESLGSLKASDPVLSRVDDKITGFKEICPVPSLGGGKRIVLAETFVFHGIDKEYSAISVIKVGDLSLRWEYVRLVHDPKYEDREWCKGDSSPCRIFNSEFLSCRLQNKEYLVGVMNGREPNQIIKGKEIYKKFRPGLFLFDPASESIVWIADEPLLEDPIASTITFASEVVYLDDTEAILYAHPNDSFVRAYKLNSSKLRELLPDRID